MPKSYEDADRILTCLCVKTEKVSATFVVGNENHRSVLTQAEIALLSDVLLGVYERQLKNHDFKNCSCLD